MARKTNKAGLDLIKSFEGCRLTAYKVAGANEQYYTIGWGHYGPDVKRGMKITQAEADQLLKNDLKTYEGYVEKYCSGLSLNDNQFAALVSFTYNCGAGSLQTLVKGRTVEQISNALLLYNKAGGNVLAGLVRRRKAEQALFNKAAAKSTKPKAKKEVKSVKYDAAKSFSKSYAKTYKVTASSLNMRTGAGTKKGVITVLKKGTKVTCHGYYTKNGLTKWLLVEAGSFTGYVSKKYLK